MRLNLKEFGAVLCDLDGVITQTARLHAAAWKRLFDDYLQEVAARTRSPFKPFDLEEDYRVYVDGKPRHEGVRDFLASRKMSLPPGTPSDGSDRETLYGLGRTRQVVWP
jgi:beta-phosphoglucomutase-like phosphatase (HAD superfamily)